MTEAGGKRSAAERPRVQVNCARSPGRSRSASRARHSDIRHVGAAARLGHPTEGKQVALCILVFTVRSNSSPPLRFWPDGVAATGWASSAGLGRVALITIAGERASTSDAPGSSPGRRRGDVGAGLGSLASKVLPAIVSPPPASASSSPASTS